ncbi:MAG: redoxin domain-containing protein [Dehalococcoidia bacterium]|nr:redoxin domain-containing protein [Dehalococcoidia bacterium]
MTSERTEQELPPSRRNPEGEPPSGPDAGERLPDFTLPDQHGRTVTFSEARGSHRALVVFYRSARW